MIVPARRQPFAHRQFFEFHFELHALVLAGAGRALGVNESITARRSGREIELVKREQRLGDQQMRMAQWQIGNERAFHCSAGRLIFKIASVRSDKQTRPEEAAFLVSKSPGYIRWLRPDFAEINSSRQENVIPGLTR